MTEWGCPNWMVERVHALNTRCNAIVERIRELKGHEYHAPYNLNLPAFYFDTVEDALAAFECHDFAAAEGYCLEGEARMHAHKCGHAFAPNAREFIAALKLRVPCDIHPAALASIRDMFSDMRARINDTDYVIERARVVQAWVVRELNWNADIERSFHHYRAAYYYRRRADRFSLFRECDAEVH